MIALTIFFIAIFSILDLTGRCLRSARALQHSTVDATGVASALTLTNRLTEGALPGDLIGQFEELHPGFSCDGEIYQVGSNGLFQIDLAVISTERKGHIEGQMSLLLYRPDSAAPGRTLSSGGRR